jgi:WD40 repeat protein
VQLLPQGPISLGSLIAALTAFIIVLVQVEEKRMKDQKTSEEIQKYAEAGQDRLDNGRYLQAAVFFAAAYRLQEGVSAMTEQLQKGLIECSKAALAKQILIMNGHADWVTSAAFSNDGQHLVTASWDKTIRLWNLNTGASKVIAQSVGKMASVNLSPDGTRIVGGCWDGYAYVWELDGKLLATLDGHRGRVVYAAFSPDGKRIVTASEDATARAWSTDGKPLFIIKGHTDSVKSAVYSPDGSSILTAGFDGTAKIWDSSSGQLLRTIDAAKEGQKSLNFAAFSPDGKRMATVGLSPEVIIWDLDGQRVGRLSAHAKRINYVQFDHSGTLLVTASDEDNVKVWDLPHGQLSMSLDRHKGNLALSAVFNPDDSRLVTTGSDRTARLWDARLRKENFSELVTTIEKESPWKIVGGELKEQ